MKIINYNDLAITNYPELAIFCEEIYNASVFFSDVLDLYTKIEYSSVDKNQFSSRAVTVEWVSLASHKLGNTKNAVFLCSEDPFCLHIEHDGLQPYFIELSESLFSVSIKNLNFVINNMRFTLDDAMEYIHSYKNKENRDYKFTPVFNSIKVISQNDLKSVDALMLENCFVGSSSSFEAIDPDSMELPDLVQFALEDIQESLDSLSIHKDFFRMAGVVINGIPAIGLYSDSRIMSYSVEELLVTNEKLNRIFIKSYKTDDSKSSSINVYDLIKSDIESMREKANSLFGGDIPKNVESALSEFEEKIKRY